MNSNRKYLPEFQATTFKVGDRVKLKTFKQLKGLDGFDSRNMSYREVALPITDTPLNVETECTIDRIHKHPSGVICYRMKEYGGSFYDWMINERLLPENPDELDFLA